MVFKPSCMYFVGKINTQSQLSHCKVMRFIRLTANNHAECRPKYFNLVKIKKVITIKICGKCKSMWFLKTWKKRKLLWKSVYSVNKCINIYRWYFKFVFVGWHGRFHWNSMQSPSLQVKYISCAGFYYMVCRCTEKSV